MEALLTGASFLPDVMETITATTTAMWVGNETTQNLETHISLSLESP
mgnify:CR=1 FL=1